MERKWRKASLTVVDGTLVSHQAEDWLSQEAPRSGVVLVEVELNRPRDERIVFLSDDVEVHMVVTPLDGDSSLLWTEPLDRMPF